MSDEVSMKEKGESPKVATADGPTCPLDRKGWLKGPLGMAVCG